MYYCSSLCTPADERFAEKIIYSGKYVYRVIVYYFLVYRCNLSVYNILCISVPILNIDVCQVNICTNLKKLRHIRPMDGLCKTTFHKYLNRTTRIKCIGRKRSFIIDVFVLSSFHVYNRNTRLLLPTVEFTTNK